MSSFRLLFNQSHTHTHGYTGMSKCFANEWRLHSIKEMHNFAYTYRYTHNTWMFTWIVRTANRKWSAYAHRSIYHLYYYSLVARIRVGFSCEISHSLPSHYARALASICILCCPVANTNSIFVDRVNIIFFLLSFFVSLRFGII